MVTMMMMVSMVMISRPEPMFTEDLLQRDRPSDLRRKAQLADRIAVASNHIWINHKGLYDDPAMAMPVGDNVPSLRGRNP